MAWDPIPPEVRARLRTKIFIAFSSLIIAVLLATLGQPFTESGQGK